MTESVPQWRVDDARNLLNTAIERSIGMGIRFEVDVSQILTDYVAASDRAARLIEVCNEQRRIVNAELQIAQANEEIEHLKTKL